MLSIQVENQAIVVLHDCKTQQFADFSVNINGFIKYPNKYSKHIFQFLPATNLPQLGSFDTKKLAQSGQLVRRLLNTNNQTSSI